MAEIPLTMGKVAIVDDADYEWLTKLGKWQANQTVGGGWRAQRRFSIGPGKRKTLCMHRVIMGEPDGMDVDRRDLDGLNNRRLNLRVATRQQNTRNSRAQRNSSSGYPGVHWNTKEGKWAAVIYVSRQRKFLGYFGEKEAARVARDAAAKSIDGEFFRLGGV